MYKSVRIEITLNHENQREAGKVVVFLFRTSRAVRCVLERGEDMLITGARHPVLGKYKVQQHHSGFHFSEVLKMNLETQCEA